jgi:hypothetical protein
MAVYSEEQPPHGSQGDTLLSRRSSMALVLVSRPHTMTLHPLKEF